MEQYNITGMSCAACQARIEKAVGKLDGVEECNVNLLTNSMSVEGTADSKVIISAVEAAGYGAKLKRKANDARLDSSNNNRANIGQDNSSDYENEYDNLDNKSEISSIKNRLIYSLIFLVVLMYFSMGHMMWGFPLPKWFDGNHVAMALVQLLLATIVMVINQKFFVNGFKGLIHRSPNMDTLVALGSFVSYAWSVVVMFQMTDGVVKGDSDKVMQGMDNLYFESAAMILTLITVGKLLEAKAKGKTTDAIKSLMKLAPKTAIIIENGEEKIVPIEDIKVGDIFVVKPGANVPVDGVVVEGTTSIDESALTGESVPVDKAIGKRVFAATTNQSGYIQCEATKVGAETTLSQIIKMVSDASATKAPIAKIADKVSGVFVPVVLAISAVTIIIWLLVGEEIGFALARGISVLVISCPCALGLATPVAIMVGNGVGAKHGILFKTAVALEQAGKIDVVVLDKTGTITKGAPEVTDVISMNDINHELSDDENSKNILLKYAASLEAKSEHPLSKAVMKYYENIGASDSPANGTSDSVASGTSDSVSNGSFAVSDFEAVPGCGLMGIVDGKELIGGNLEFVSSKLSSRDKLYDGSGDKSVSTLCDEADGSFKLKSKVEALSKQGKTPLIFAYDGKLLGIIAVADTIKEDSRSAVSALKSKGIKVVMLTGDNEQTAKAIAASAGIDDVVAGVLPDGKQAVIEELKKQGQVMMVGDGINDAPALTAADIGTAIGAGADIAIDAADVVLMNSRLSDVVSAIELSRKTLKNIHENLFWAFFYNIMGIPLAAGAYIHLFGWTLNPMFGAAAMSLSSFCVVTNALRLNFAKISYKNNTIEDNENVTINNSTLNNQKGNIKMKKTINVEGMMCGHCEARVKKVLEAIDGVNEAIVSHESGTAVVELSSDVSDEVLKKAIEDADYVVTGISES